ncbi:uncharacterized protein LOC132034574 [Lycium ferocissimum]|uniref:uncharacterized protein LOC132034574 n=1 Tax=Lycium ferocissimum TaxID=112874 RepID=UPI0028153150|nr:uncharacterized protein LOC132034574 [Lycium ferocissimum]
MGRPKKPPTKLVPVEKRPRGRPRKTAQAVGDNPAPAEVHVSCFAPAATSAQPTAKRGRGSGTSATYKRPRVMGMGVFQAENGFKAVNPGMSSSRIVSTSKSNVTSSAEVTGDIGYKPSANSKLKWRGNEAITTRKLQEIQEKMTKGRGKSANPSQESTCSQSKQPWKI